MKKKQEQKRAAALQYDAGKDRAPLLTVGMFTFIGSWNALGWPLLVTNTPLYAGEFRFDADNSCDDGRLDLHLFSGPFDYLDSGPGFLEYLHYLGHYRRMRGLGHLPRLSQNGIGWMILADQKEVTTGLEGNEYTVVTSGVNEGDLVITNAAEYKLKDGQKVKI